MRKGRETVSVKKNTLLQADITKEPIDQDSTSLLSPVNLPETTKMRPNIIVKTALDKFKEKVATFDLNPDKQIIKLKFKSKKYDYAFTFNASKKMKCETLMTALIDHFGFDVMKTIPSNEYEVMSENYQWIMLVNYSVISDFEMQKDLAYAGIKPLDLITLQKVTKRVQKYSPF